METNIDIKQHDKANDKGNIKNIFYSRIKANK